MATASEKTNASTGSRRRAAAGSSLKKAAQTAAGLSGIGASLGDFLRFFGKSGTTTLIRRFMEPIYIIRSMNGKKAVRNILNTILLALSLLLLAGAVAGRLSEERTGRAAGIFGIKPVVVMSGSMEPALKTHSLALVRMTKNVEKGDILLFENGGALVLHRFLEETDDSSVITGGDNNAEADYTPLPRENILGRVVLPLNFTAPLAELIWKIRDGDLVRTSVVPEPLPEDEMLSLMNSCRAESGLGDLSFLPSLAEAASIRAREASVCWSHTRPDGSAWYTAGAGTACGENLAKGFRTAAEACAAWMSSPSHAANILFPGFRYVSIGSYISPAGTRYWSVEFA